MIKKNSISSKLSDFFPFIILFILMLLIHNYIFLYADDFYYSRDAQYGLSYLPDFIIKQLNANGRVWVHILLLGLVRYDVIFFRLVNPIVITLTAILFSKIFMFNSRRDKQLNKYSYFISALSACLLFLLIPIEISYTTLFYAACALNYLYPMLIVILYGFLLFSKLSNSKKLSKRYYLLIVLSFFAASSTQQAGMIAIGFTVLSHIYFTLFKKLYITKSFIPLYLSLFSGYALVTYGSIKRLLIENNNGIAPKLIDTITGLLKTNIFSEPVSVFIILTCVLCILWLLYFSFKINKNKYFVALNTILSVGLVLSVVSYIYVVLFQGFEVSFTSNDLSLKIKLFYIIFTCAYLFSLLYVSILIMIYKDFAFILFCIINAIGAQVMLVIADARFANAYKIMFPSLLLIFIFIGYSIVNLFIINKRVLLLISTPLILIASMNFITSYNGYKHISEYINYNLDSIEEHRESPDDILTLKTVPYSQYGYNLGNWNTLPYFMKQCYKINESTNINYID